ncbi:CDP-diacylglycerol--glycerol-3-phosphate 3-phosphatidyltransferase [invertebrate metagenome]|uniref:CDP-diacylglycerol--glycerol-3-phosphate 3-phosphatidyltransferase n=1 Tax=invertebrate metagenome TaxID=1711999 RepID=A0A484H625_9ZZZZ
MRLLVAPLAVWMIHEGMLAVAFWLFTAAAVTDAADGALAKMLNACTRIGSYLDPLADKALLVGVYVAMGFAGYLPRWLVALVVLRDCLIIGGAIFYELIIGNIRMQPLVISKLNTLGQIFLAGMLLGGYGLGIDVEPILDPMLCVVGVTAVLSAVAYSWTWGRAALANNDHGSFVENYINLHNQ